MMLAGASLGSSALASLTPLSTATTDADALKPFRLYISGMEMATAYREGSGSMSAALGEQATFTFTLINPGVVIANGLPVRWLYFSEVLFDGMLTSWRRAVEPSQSAVIYECTASDWSVLLARHKVRRNFVNASLFAILDSLIENELAGCGLSIGTIESSIELPLVNSRGGSALDVLKEAAGVLGLTLTINQDRRIDLRAVALPVAPFTIDESILEQILTVETSLDDYRNVQTVTVTGTPPEGADAIEVTAIDTNDEQIAERAAIEGTDGRYEAVDTVTHPTSNDPTALQLLAQSVATAKLAVYGTPIETVSCLVRGYGWQPGQVAAISHAGASLSGTYTVHNVEVKDVSALFLRTTVGLSASSYLRRAYQSWLRIIDRGDIVVQLPGTTGLSTVNFTTSGSTSWTVPAGVTLVTITTKGGSGGGGGGAAVSTVAMVPRTAYGGTGGASGKTVSSVQVTPGEILTIVIGVKGIKGVTQNFIGSIPATISGAAGTAGTATTVSRGGAGLSQANGGGGGGGGTASTVTNSSTNGATGSAGGGANGAVTVGGGQPGGARGSTIGFSILIQPANGLDGSVSIQY